MDSKTLLLVASMLYVVDVSNAFLCYNCTSALNAACGETLGVTTGLQQINCPASAMCMVSKSTMDLQGTMMTMYSRSCEQFACNQGCIVMEGINMCGNCCNTDLCNANFIDPSSVGPAGPGTGGAGAGGAGTGGAGAGGAGAGAGGAGAGAGGANPEPTATQPPVQNMTTKSSAISVVVNFATVFLAGLLSTSMF